MLMSLKKKKTMLKLKQMKNIKQNLFKKFQNQMMMMRKEKFYMKKKRNRNNKIKMMQKLMFLKKNQTMKKIMLKLKYLKNINKQNLLNKFQNEMMMMRKKKLNLNQKYRKIIKVKN